MIFRRIISSLLILGVGAGAFGSSVFWVGSIKEFSGIALAASIIGVFLLLTIPYIVCLVAVQGTVKWCRMAAYIASIAILAVDIFAFALFYKDSKTWALAGILLAVSWIFNPIFVALAFFSGWFIDLIYRHRVKRPVV